MTKSSLLAAILLCACGTRESTKRESTFTVTPEFIDKAQKMEGFMQILDGGYIELRPVYLSSDKQVFAKLAPGGWSLTSAEFQSLLSKASPERYVEQFKKEERMILPFSTMPSSSAEAAYPTYVGLLFKLKNDMAMAFFNGTDPQTQCLALKAYYAEPNIKKNDVLKLAERVYASPDRPVCAAFR